MPDLRVFFSSCAVLFPVSGALLVWRLSTPRTVSAVITALSLVCSLAAVFLTPAATGWLFIDSFAAAPVIIFTGVILAIIATAPSRDVSGQRCALILANLAGTLTIYMAGNLVLLLAGWLISSIPFYLHPESNRLESRKKLYASPAFMLGFSSLLLAIAIVLFGDRAPGPVHNETAWLWAFGFATAAALVRSGIFPFHGWVISSFDREKLLPAAALSSGQAGAFLIGRLTTMLPVEAQHSLPFVSGAALVNSILMAFLALAETNPARLLALIAASQGGFIIVGLENRNVEGIAGALVHWLVVSSGVAGLAIVVRCLQARCGSLIDERFAGLGARAPRFAVFFLIFALALIGLPGTLGFAAEDLLFHGALEAHPALGIALPLATALAAISLLRGFANLFWGKRAIHVPAIRDSIARERLPLIALALFLVLAGLMPQVLIDSRLAPARSIANALNNTAEVPAQENTPKP